MTASLSATRYSHEFIRKHLPERAQHILEIGCGSGDLAALLQADGYRVLAIDSDPDAVAQARLNGVSAVTMAWPNGLDQQFDSILFTRSLHHIEPLDSALSAAVEALKPGGRIIVEDHRAEGGTARSSSWYSGLVRLLEASGAFRSDVDAMALLSKIEPDDHSDHLHPSAAIAAALERLGQVQPSDAAYYFRYLEPHFRAPSAPDRMLEHEIALIDSGAIDPLGVRFVLSIL